MQVQAWAFKKWKYLQVSVAVLGFKGQTMMLAEEVDKFLDK